MSSNTISFHFGNLDNTDCTVTFGDAWSHTYKKAHAITFTNDPPSDVSFNAFDQVVTLRWTKDSSVSPAIYTLQYKVGETEFFTLKTGIKTLPTDLGLSMRLKNGVVIVGALDILGNPEE